MMLDGKKKKDCKEDSEGNDWPLLITIHNYKVLKGPGE